MFLIFISPNDITPYCTCQLCMTLVIGVPNGKFSKCCEMTFYPIQPRGIGGQENEFYIVFLAPRCYFIFQVRAKVIEYDI
jgi:hypothetical protein